jgi:DNA repair protein RadA/Sms
MGKCPDCGTWDSLTEQTERKEPAGKGRSGPVHGMNQPIPLREVPTGGFERLPVLGEEFSRVLGGGMVPGSLVLIGGDPGIGKCVISTAAQFADQVGPARHPPRAIQQIAALRDGPIRNRLLYSNQPDRRRSRSLCARAW